MKDWELINAIEYAMRHEPVEEEAVGEYGEYRAEIFEAESLLPFVKCLLRELKVIE